MAVKAAPALKRRRGAASADRVRRRTHFVNCTLKAFDKRIIIKAHTRHGRAPQPSTALALSHFPGAAPHRIMQISRTARYVVLQTPLFCSSFQCEFAYWQTHCHCQREDPLQKSRRRARGTFRRISAFLLPSQKELAGKVLSSMRKHNFHLMWDSNPTTFGFTGLERYHTPDQRCAKLTCALYRPVKNRRLQVSNPTSGSGGSWLGKPGRFLRGGQRRNSSDKKSSPHKYRSRSMVYTHQIHKKNYTNN